MVFNKKYNKALQLTTKCGKLRLLLGELKRYALKDKSYTLLGHFNYGV